MTPEEAVAARILTLSDVTTIVGDRVYLDKAPQGERRPTVVVQLVHADSDHHLRGSAPMPARVQVDARVAEADGVDAMASVLALAEAIDGDGAGSGLDGWIGTIGSPPFAVTGILRIERRREYEPAEYRLLRMRQDYWVHFREL